MRINVLYFLLTGLICCACSCGSHDIARPERHLYGKGSHDGPLSVEAQEKIAAYFSVIEGNFRKDDMDAMRRLNPDLKFLAYINSTYVTLKNDDEIRLIESDYRDGIEMFLAAGLASDITATTRAFKLQPVDGAIRLRASTTPGDLSKSTRYFVTWMRISDEYMRIDAFDPSTGHVRVTRGFAGTTPAAHASQARVFSPIYIGWRAWPGYPGAEEETNLRYALSVSNERIYEDKAKILFEKMTEKGYDGAKYDILGNVFYNMSDALGTQVLYPWNFQKDAPYTVSDYLRQQERKMAFVQEYIFSKTGRYPVLFGNSLSSREYYPEGGGSMYFLMSTDVKPRPMDGFQMENFVSVVKRNTFRKISDWKTRVNMVKHASHHGRGGVALIQWTNMHKKGNPDPWILQHEIYGYTSYLLGIEPDESTYVGTPVFMKLPDSQEQVVALFPQYLYQLGNPAETAEKIEMYKRSDADVFQRRYEHGLVLVNPTTADCTDLSLARAYYDPDAQQNVEAVSLPAHTGKILLDQPPNR
jgi:hypothetical protein